MGVCNRRALAAVLALAAAGFGPRTAGPRVPADTLTALPGATTGTLRVAAQVRFGRTSPEWQRFQTLVGGSWQAQWDAATGVPQRIWGSGIAFPGANADPAVAEAAARQILGAHIALLAPGSAVTDFQLISNTSDGAIRSLGFVQYSRGHAVIGGQISFEFKNDRLFVIGSAAFPNVTVTNPSVRLARADFATRVTGTLRTAVQLPNAPVSAPGAEVILPLVGDGAVLGYRLVRAVEIDGKADGRYTAYADTSTGALVAIQQRNMYATGIVDYHGVDRWQGRGYVDRPAPRAHITLDGAPETTMQDGTVTWSPDSAVTLATAAVGDLVTVVNRAMDSNASATANLPLTPGATVVWDAHTSEEDDAQLNAYIDTNIAKEYIRANVDPQLPGIDNAMTVNVNLNQTCNAFWDGTALNFFASGDSMGRIPCQSGATCCDNTALIQDVNFHEYGHQVHGSEVIPGVGHFDGAMSEGAADFLAASITGDHGMGRGFTLTDDPLRDIDPPNREYKWPDDISTDIHATGLIYSGALWDMRKALIAQYGDSVGISITNQIYVGTLRRSVDIPSSLIEALAADDDDGNLANGTPHECFIRNAWAIHGMRTVFGTIEAPGVLEQTTASIGVTISVNGLSSCGEDVPTEVSFFGNGSSVLATPNGQGRWVAQLDLLPEKATQYAAQVEFADGTNLRLPDNITGHDHYQTWTGPTVKLYCTSFDDGDPFAKGWTTGTNDNTPSTWSVNRPLGDGYHPPSAYDGVNALTQTPMGNYAEHLYTWAKTPEITTGQYSDVHLQYWRWLSVQDSLHDQARILANDTAAWENYTDTGLGAASEANHIDKEWRFQDVPLSGYFAATKLVVGWTLNSDGDLDYAGWSIDHVCIVANPTQICGDGVRGLYEECDNGSANADVPNKCRTYCRLPTCGDDIVDDNEECDNGSANANKPDHCRTTCKKPVCGDNIVDSGEECDGSGSSGKIDCNSDCTLGGGCCEAGGSGGGGACVLAALIVFVLRRRR